MDDAKVISIKGWKARKDRETLEATKEQLGALDDYQLGVYVGPEAPGHVVLNFVHINSDGIEEKDSIFMPPEAAIAFGVNMQRAGRMVQREG